MAHASLPIKKDNIRESIIAVLVKSFTLYDVLINKGFVV